MTGGDQLHVMVADVIKSFDTVDRSILDCALGRLGLPGWFRKVCFSFHSQVRLRFKLAAGLGEPWCRDGGIPQGCPLSTVFKEALYVPWCRHLDALPDVKPQLYAEYLSLCPSSPALSFLCPCARTGPSRRSAARVGATSAGVALSDGGLRPHRRREQPSLRPLCKQQKLGHTLVLRLLETSCLVVVVVVRTCSCTRMSIHTCTRHAKFLKGQHQCARPFGWTDQPAKAQRLLPPKAGSRRPRVQNSPNPKSRKKIARLAYLTPHSSGGRGGAIFSISSALDAQDPEYCEKMHLDVSSWLAGPFYPALPPASER